MATQWGRKETIIWPPHVPMLSYTAVATALLCTCLFIWQRFTVAYGQGPAAPASGHCRGGRRWCQSRGSWKVSSWRLR